MGESHATDLMTPSCTEGLGNTDLRPYPQYAFMAWRRGFYLLKRTAAQSVNISRESTRAIGETEH